MGLRTSQSAGQEFALSIDKNFKQYVSMIINCFSKELFHLDSIKQYVSILALFLPALSLRRKTMTMIHFLYKNAIHLKTRAPTENLLIS